MSATTEERLAALQARRPAHARGGPSETPPGQPSSSPGTARRGTGTDTSDAVTTRRRSPATSTKILLAGASTTAVLGIVAALGVAERASSAGQSGGDEMSTEPSPEPVIPPSTDAPPIPPTLAVVVLDAAGVPLAATTIDPAASGPAVVSIDFLATTPTQPTRAREPGPGRVRRTAEEVVPVPVVVDVAVPAAPRPRPAPASSSSPVAQAPAPSPPAPPDTASHGS